MKVTETRIESLKLTVAGIHNTSTINTPTGSWASTSHIPSDFTNMIEKAITELTEAQHQSGIPGECEEDEQEPKRLRKAVEIPRPNLHLLWNQFQESLFKVAQISGNPGEQNGPQGQQDVVMRASGE